MKSIFETIASNNNWAFSYGRQDFHNLEDLETDSYHLFVDPIVKTPSFSKAGLPKGQTDYEGRFMILIKSDMDEVYDGQKDQDKLNGKYEKYIKPITEEGGVIEELILDALVCTYDLEIKTWRIIEVVNQFDTNFDGAIVNFKLCKY